MSELAIMGKEGDTKVIWDPNVQDEVDNAARTFDDLKRKGYLAYEVSGKDASKGEMITAFDAKAGRIIMAPPMAGG